MSEQIQYKISLYPTTKVIAKHKTPAKNIPFSQIILYLTPISSDIWTWISKQKKYMYSNFSTLEAAFFNYLVLDLIEITLLERICLECRLNNSERVSRGLGKIRIQGRCKEFKDYPCKMYYITEKVFELLEK